MNVLWFSPTPCGATEYITHQKAIGGGWLFALEKQLKDVVNLSVCFPVDYPVKIFDLNGVRYVPFHLSHKKRLLMRLLGRHLIDFRQLKDVVDMVKPDIIHVHGTESVFHHVVKVTDIPVVISMQSILSPYVDKYFSGIPQFDCYKNNLKDFVMMRSEFYMYRLTMGAAKEERDTFRNLKYIMGRTDWDYKISRLLAPNSTYFHGDEILRDSFYHKKWQPNNNEKWHILTIMSTAPYKGLEVVYKTANILSEYGYQFEWAIVGQDANNSYNKLVRKFLKIKNKSLNILFVGKKNEQELAEVFLKSDVFVQVSHIENSPNSLCEAMILGLPIIASNVGGTNSLMTNGEDGYLVQDGDSFILASTIVHLFKHYHHAIEMGLHGREKAIKRHCQTTIRNQMLDCYNNIMHVHKEIS